MFDDVKDPTFHEMSILQSTRVSQAWSLDFSSSTSLDLSCARSCSQSPSKRRCNSKAEDFWLDNSSRDQQEYV